ncbi:tetratricopeptide repeat protein, partial [Actinoplanes sp. NPDC051633]|uniref:protein kinase domain-containing protein n=1 Tax=Actinoplanes sp. NPDC051633 TaxID=3155670 RepID=UPI0034150A69
MKCPRPGCTGTIDDTKFCDTCNRPAPAGRSTVEAMVEPTVESMAGSTVPPAVDEPSSVEGPKTFDVAGLVPMPVLVTADPTSRLMDGTEVLSARRRCGRNGCTGEIGGSYAGQPAVLEGVCDECGHPYSLKARLKKGDLVAGQYEVMGPLAQSGFGWVYLARDRHLDDNYVVLKGLINANDSRAAEMAVRERQYLTRLNHTNIVRIYNAVTHTDAKTGEHTGYIVMGYVDGPSLDEVRRLARTSGRDSDRLPLEHILGMGHEILAALDYLHGQGLLYCDMKPANVMRGSDRITVIDLGAMTEIAAADRSTVGTVPYRAPKEELQTRGATVKSDVHTVGRTLEKLFADAGRAGDVPPIAAESFDRLIRRAVEPDYPRRFASAAEMSEQLVGVLRELLSLRDGTEHAAASMLFAPTAELIDGELGMVPPLERWTTRRLPSGVADPPSNRSVALGLPIPRTDPFDPGARFLGGGLRRDPRDLIARLQEGGENSAELWLRGCRAHLELGDTAPAERCLEAAEKILGGTPGAWRLEWYGGLLAFARGDIADAAALFTAVR